MILLIGGTSETPEIANLLAENGIEVLISNLTDSAAGWDLSGGVRLRCGGLDAGAMCGLIAEEGITAIVDASHPYAEELHNNAVESCCRMNISYFRYERPGADYDGFNVEFAASHEDGAELAFRIGQRVLLTTGSRNLAPYVKAARDTDSKLYVRVLPGEESAACCRDSGVDRDAIITGQGPFTVECNTELIKKHSIDLLVTKDSGLAGGVGEKLQAAGTCGIKVVVIRRPVIEQKTGECFEVISELIEEVICHAKGH